MSESARIAAADVQPPLRTVASWLAMVRDAGRQLTRDEITFVLDQFEDNLYNRLSFTERQWVIDLALEFGVIDPALAADRELRDPEPPPQSGFNEDGEFFITGPLSDARKSVEWSRRNTDIVMKRLYGVDINAPEAGFEPE